MTTGQLPTSTRHTTRRRRQVVVVGLLVNVLGFVTVACGVSTGDSSFESIEGGEFAGLNESTSTTSTTTSTTTTMPDPVDSQPESTSTTTMPPPQASVEVYFIARGSLQPAERLVEPNYTANLLIAALELGADDASFALESYVDEGLVVGQPVAERGVLNIELDDRIYDRTTTRSKRFAIAQIVLTMTSNIAGIGQVAFFIDGEPIAVPTDRGTLEQVTREDFLELTGTPRNSIEPAPPATESTTTTTQI